MKETLQNSNESLATKRLPELKAMASELGIKMPAGSRKAQYIEAISQKLATATPAESTTPGEKKTVKRTRVRKNNRTEKAVEEADKNTVSEPSESATTSDNETVDNPAEAARKRVRRERATNRNRKERVAQEKEKTLDTEDKSAESNAQPVKEDNFLPVAGILDVAGNNYYLRTTGYLPGLSDAYISQQMVKRYGLRRGDAIVGSIRPANDNHRRGQRQHKYNPLADITTINGLSPEAIANRPEFNKLTPLYSQEMLRTETTKQTLTTRIIDLVSPIGKGQRGLIVSPPKAGKTIVMQQLATAIAKNDPNVHIMVVLVDERPEEVTDMQRLVKGEVIASTFDRPASDHTIVAELAVERAKRLVELGQDVVILLDSLTRLSRAYNLAAPASGRILSGGVDAAALYPPKKFFGAARNIENGGSLTIIASALVETGSKMDEVIFEEFKGTGNMELRLSRQLADRRIFPAVDINASGTRREELLFSPEELQIVWNLRRGLGALDVQEASDYLLNRLRKTESNREFLMSIVRGMRNSNE